VKKTADPISLHESHGGIFVSGLWFISHKSEKIYYGLSHDRIPGQVAGASESGKLASFRLKSGADIARGSFRR
jgi:hypothetical protein